LTKSSAGWPPLQSKGFLVDMLATLVSEIITL
jgi:hypothetical protein